MSKTTRTGTDVSQGSGRVNGKGVPVEGGSRRVEFGVQRWVYSPPLVACSPPIQAPVGARPWIASVARTCSPRSAVFLHV